MVTQLSATIPAPALRQLEVGPLTLRLYALSILAGIVVAYVITRRRWRSVGGDADVLADVLLWSVPAGIVGGRLYHVITSYGELGPEWYAPLAIWEGGLGIWGAIALGACVGGLVARHRGASVTSLLDAAAPGLLVAQAVGRLGNYFNQELFGEPSRLPWALEVDPARRPDGTPGTTTYHPVFLYELVWNLVAAGLLVVIGRRRAIRPPALFALYVALYSLGRLALEQFRVDPSAAFLGQRLNFFVASGLLVASVAAFIAIQRGSSAEVPSEEQPAGDEARAARSTR